MPVRACRLPLVVVQLDHQRMSHADFSLHNGALLYSGLRDRGERDELGRTLASHRVGAIEVKMSSEMSGRERENSRQLVSLSLWPTQCDYGWGGGAMEKDENTDRRDEQDDGSQTSESQRALDAKSCLLFPATGQSCSHLISLSFQANSGA